MDRMPEEAPRILSEVRRLLRVLMAETPQYAERNFNDAAEMRKVDIQDEDLAAYEITEDGSSMYIVFDHGTKYTTSIRPSQIPDAKIVRIARSQGGDVLWKRVQERAHAVKELSLNLFKTSRVGESLDSIPFLYSEEAKGPHFRHIEAVKGLGGFLELKNNDEIRSWCRACIDRLIASYGWHLLAGNEVVEPIATLQLFDYCPFPLAALLEMNRDYLRYQMGDKFMGANLTMPFPVPDIKFYLEHPAVPANLAVVWGTAIARTSQQQAEKFRDDAKTRYTADRFLGGLHMALLHYRCALYAYRAVLSLKKANQVTSDSAKTRLDEAPTEEAICEEYRVVIEASLSAAAHGIASGLRMPSIANAAEFIPWLEWMTSPSSPVDADFEIHQAYDAQLIMPTFLRDLARGRIAISKGETAKGLAKLQAVATELEKHLNEAVILGDPNYLSYIYDTMAKASSAGGMATESAEYARRAQPEYYRGLISTDS
jgi:hypothetical protein